MTDNVFENIRDWAEERDLVYGSTPQAQMLKLTEEVGELASSLARHDEIGTADAIGDCVVVLTILAAQMELDIERCVEYAYQEIKDRKGRMVEGVFIRSI